jgi:hypothetical protein
MLLWPPMDRHRGLVLWTPASNGEAEEQARLFGRKGKEVNRGVDHVQTRRGVGGGKADDGRSK